MKSVSQRFLFTVLLVLLWTDAFSQGPEVCPCGVSNGTGGSAGIPPPPGTCLPCPVPIDGSIVILLTIAVLFGIYIIYRNYLKTKNPL